jgi:hypothetical protein
MSPSEELFGSLILAKWGQALLSRRNLRFDISTYSQAWSRRKITAMELMRRFYPRLTAHFLADCRFVLGGAAA